MILLFVSLIFSLGRWSPAFGAQVPPITVQPAKSTVFNITQSDDLWFFNGQTPSNYSTTITLNAGGPTQGAFSWNVVANNKAVTLENNTGSITKLNDPTLKVTSTEISFVPNDVGISLRYNGDDVGIYNLTVFAPKKVRLLVPPAVVHTGIQTFVPLTSTPLTVGFQSVAIFQILNQFNDEIPRPVPVNEVLETTARVNDYPNANWSNPTQFSAVVSRLQDTWSEKEILPQIPGLIPHPTIPQTPLSTSGVFHLSQRYFVGTQSFGQGRQVEVHTLQYFVDHGDFFPLP